MRNFTGTVDSIVSSARRLVRRDGSGDSRREAFSQEFGAYPPYQEASTQEREQFMAEVVRPLLTERARTVDADARQAGSGSRGASEAFTRAYQVAVDMRLADKGKTYRDYLGSQG